MPAVEAKTVRTSEKATDMLQFDLENETETIRNYRERVRQCEDLTEYAMSEQIREILIDEQDHQIALATALARAFHRSVRPHRNGENSRLRHDQRQSQATPPAKLRKARIDRRGIREVS